MNLKMMHSGRVYGGGGASTGGVGRLRTVWWFAGKTAEAVGCEGGLAFNGNFSVLIGVTIR